jgi:hypothetical protein
VHSIDADEQYVARISIVVAVLAGAWTGGETRHESYGNE